MAETITLPRSGLVLTPCPDWDGWEIRLDEGARLSLQQGKRGDLWMAWKDHEDEATIDGTRDECIAWLDARVLELRAALLPPGAVVLGPGDRERIARALIHRSSPTKLVIGGASIDCETEEATDEMTARIVDGVLAALKDKTK